MKKRFLLLLLSATIAAADDTVILPVVRSLTVQPGRTEVVKFTLTAAQLAGRPALRFEARLDHQALAGSTYALRLALNGAALEADRLVNKPAETQMMSGMILAWYGQGAFRIVCSPDYQAANRDDHPACLIGGHAYDFILDVADRLRVGENVLTLSHTAPTITNPVVLRDVALVEPPERVASPVDAPAPTGPLPRCEPAPVGPVSYRLTPLPHGGMAVEVGGRRFVLRSAFSYPNAGWNTLSDTRGAGEEAGWQPVVEPTAEGLRVRAKDASFRVERTVTRHDERLEVADKLTNLTEADLHLGMRHAVVLAGLTEVTVTVHGLTARIPRVADRGGDNPTVLVRSGTPAVGVVAEDDVLRAQCAQQADPDLGEAGLLDHFFMLRPRAEYVVRWSVYPLPDGEYFSFVNAIRRTWATNFTVPGPFAFVPHPSNIGDQVTDLRAWLDLAALKVVGLQIPNPRPLELAHGLAYLNEPAEQQRLKAQADELRRLAPDLKILHYVDVYLTRDETAPERYPDDRHLGPDGKQYAYAPGSWKPPFWLFCPTLANAYGQAMAGYYDLCLDRLGFDGIYWDEMSRSAQLVIDNAEDGFSAYPNLQTMTIARKVALVPLYCRDFQEHHARRLLDAGKVLIANGQPETETLTRLRFPRFVEAWHPTNLRNAHLYCPLGLGSPDRIRHEDDLAVNIRENLEQGGLWYYYLGWSRVKLTRRTITEHMFPFTPIELRAGMLYGRERILTSRSGLFGWGDRSPRRVYVYDRKGVCQPDFAAPTRDLDGKLYTELRLPGGWLAAVVREAR